MNLPNLLGYRKVIICTLAILSTLCVSIWGNPATQVETMKYIAIITGLYCGINIFKSVSDQSKSTQFKPHQKE